VLVRLGTDEQPALAEVADDLICRLDRREPVQPAVLLVEVTRLVDRCEDGEVVDLRELEVLGAAARGDVDDSRFDEDLELPEVLDPFF
jgi:hypothetical protein